LKSRVRRSEHTQLIEHRNFASYSRVLKELLSNAWDAGAHSVQIKITSDLGEITILDDGIGMSEFDIRERFLEFEGRVHHAA
jgi:signal transduction histidine kinase